VNDNESSIALHLNPKEFEYIINVLAQRPFAEVNGLLQKMVQQANSPAPIAPEAGSTE
jgi:hypothetical protein